MPGGTTDIYGTYSSGGYAPISSIPSWLPPLNVTELQDQYRNTNQMFDTSAYDLASTRQQGRTLTTALNAGNAAAADYSNRARQAGGSGLGAGLIKAQAQTGAQTTAGAMELERQRFDASQREAAATHATGIASTLGDLRGRYLNAIVDYATREDATNAQYDISRRTLRANNRGGGGGVLTPSALVGGAGSPGELSFNNYTDYLDYLKYINHNYGELGGGG